MYYFMNELSLYTISLVVLILLLLLVLYYSDNNISISSYSVRKSLNMLDPNSN